ncbi:MAG: methyltransferase domain-containing protein [Candidatus Diapherotrites archaeon]|nr:methyltransferase domain-containing protein [Candidatus Diapherotrites archaeon]
MKILLIHSSGKTLMRDWRGEDIQTSWGEVLGSEIGKVKESNKAVPITTSKGEHFLAIKPLLRDIIQKGERGARPLYEYDAGIAGALMSLQNGMVVLEAGTGSACATLMFAQMVHPGKVISFEKDERFYELAKRKLADAVVTNVELHHENLFMAALEENSFDAVFLDLLEEVEAVKKTVSALKPGRFMCVYCPVEAKVDGVVEAMKEKRLVDIEVVDLNLKRHVITGEKSGPCFPGFFVCGRRFKSV